MRLIDADALGVGRCSRDILPAEYCAGWNGLLGLIESAPTIEQPQWIPVTERLPEKRKVTLVCDNRMGFVGIAEFFPRDKVLCSHWVYDGETYSVGEFTHWMPLPVPPKGDE